jgi:hypothetical protein
MLKKIIVLFVLSSFTGPFALKAEPTPKPKPQSSATVRKESTARVAPVQPLPKGWSIVQGVWMHSDGYKFVKGQVVRIGAQTRRRPPSPPTQADFDAARKKKNAPPTAAEIAAAKAAEVERNKRPRPAPQTGTHL